MRVHAFLTLLLALLFAQAADASRRPVRVDGFGSWNEFDIPSPSCPGTQANSTLVQWSGYVFSGRNDAVHLFDTYCQVPAPGTLNTDNYNPSGEEGLMALIGANPSDRVTAIRFSMLDRDRFNFDDPPSGFQWMFFRFEAGDTDTMIIALYGLEDVVLGSNTYIALGHDRLFDAARDGYDGEYFCFANDIYLGTWDGSLATPSECVTSARRVFRGSFE